MKEDEKRFFIACYRFGRASGNRLLNPVTASRLGTYLTPREIVNILRGYIHHKRCWYYLQKWCGLGFYDYGVTLDLGWFYPEKLPERYKKLLED